LKNSNFFRNQVIKKIAFLVNDNNPILYSHYQSVWKELKRESFVIVLLSSEENRTLEGRHFIKTITALGYRIDHFLNIIQHGYKYQNVVSNHSMGGSSLRHSQAQKKLIQIKNVIKTVLNRILVFLGKTSRFALDDYNDQYFPLRIGIKQIRFMYGADISDGYSLQKWNRMYDLFLCHGSNDKEQIQKRFNGKTIIIGYPRYDRYFLRELDVSNIIREFKVVQSKKTILWLPTFDAFLDNTCSIPFFAKEIAKLKENFNIIVRPHPNSFHVEKDNIKLLEYLSFNIDSNVMRDTSDLFRISDVVLCDYGGSAFGALYLGKKLLFLEVPVSANAAIVKNSSNLEIMKHFPILKVEDIKYLENIINNERYWQECMNNAKNLSKKYFSDYRGSSSLKAADVLNNIGAYGL
jgi:hypothetical protein